MNAYRIIEVGGFANQTDHVESLIEVRTEQKTAPADVAKHDGDAKPVESTAWSVEPTLPPVWRLAAPWRADVEQRRMALGKTGNSIRPRGVIDSPAAESPGPPEIGRPHRADASARTAGTLSEDRRALIPLPLEGRVDNRHRRLDGWGSRRSARRS